MKAVTFILSLTLLAIKVLADEGHEEHTAPIVDGNPKQATFQAVLQAGKPIQGQITGVSNENGTGVNFNINFYDFPASEDGPFKYHIHSMPVSEDGNCSSAGPHLSPYGREDTPACDSSDPATCQPGDLTGKHGSIADTSTEKNFQKTYLDLYLSTDPEDLSFFGNRSIVVHANNGTRLNCGNFVQHLATNNTSNSTGGSGSGPEGSNPVNGQGYGNGTSTTTSATSTHTGGAERSIEVLKTDAFALALGLGLVYALLL